MAIVKSKTGSAKRFGPRYGRTKKEIVGNIEKMQHGPHKCPSCHQLKVKRLALGIWQCQKCHTKFAGKAYSISKKIAIRAEEEIPEEVNETIQEEGAESDEL